MSKSTSISQKEIAGLFDSAGFKVAQLEIERATGGSKGVKISFRLSSGEQGVWHLKGDLPDAARSRICAVKQLITNARRSTFG